MPHVESGTNSNDSEIKLRQSVADLFFFSFWQIPPPLFLSLNSFSFGETLWRGTVLLVFEDMQEETMHC